MKEDNSPTVEIIILNFNGQSDTIECLQSLQKMTYSNAVITVLDNGSNIDETVQLKKIFSSTPINFIRSEENLGFAQGNNSIAYSSSAKYVVFLNNDTVVDPQWLEPIVETFESDLDVAAIQPKLRAYHAPEFFEYAGAAGGFIDQLGYPYARGRIGFDLEKDEGQYDDPIEIFWASGSAIALRTEVVKKVNGMPKEFFFHHEEIDMCWRIQNAGYKILSVPQSVVFHKGLGSSANILPKKVFYVHRNNILLLLRNLSFLRMLWVIPLRCALDLICIAWYLLQGHFHYALAVLKAYYSVATKLSEVRSFRKSYAYPRTAENKLRPFSIFFHYTILQHKRYSEVAHVHKKTETKYYGLVLPKTTLQQQNNKVFSLVAHAYVLYAMLTVLFIVSWFRFGGVYASGEEGLSLVFPTRSADVYNSVWYETGTGYPMPVVYPRVPLLAILGLLDSILPISMIQALLYGGLLFAGMAGTFLFIRYITHQRLIAVLSGIFYVTNVYTMSQVWGRMLNAGIILWAFYPWFLYLWLKLMKEGSVKVLLLFVFASFLASYSYGQPASLIVVWLSAAMLTLYCVVSNAKQSRTIIIRSVLGGISWIATSLWWLIPYIQWGSSSFSTVSDPRANLDSLIGVSQYFPVHEILLLRQSFILQAPSFAGWYYTPTADYLLFAVCSIAILGMLSSLAHPKGRILVVLLILGFFISKGSNPPFGLEIFSFLFTNIPSLQSLRNPYEKAGIIFVLPYVTFIAAGIYYIRKHIASTVIGNMVTLLITSLIATVLVWPMWKAQVFGGGVINTRLYPPTDYAEVNNYLRTQNNDGKIAVLPFILGDGIKYHWPNGSYNGLESSEFLFERPAISKILRTEYFDQKYEKLVKSFGSPEFLTYTEQMHIRYLILHTAVAWQDLKLLSPDQIRSTLQNYPQIQKVHQTENTETYTIHHSSPTQHISTDQNIKVNYQKHSPTIYDVDITDATRPYKLIFKETFNPRWTATIANQQIDEHHIIYDYANSWQINQTGSYTIRIELK